MELEPALDPLASEVEVVEADVEGLVDVLDSKLLKVGATEVDILAMVLDDEGEGRDALE